MNDAQQCRLNGWKPGTVLAGDQGFGRIVITITAVGEERILAKGSDGKERHWTLAMGNWKEVEQDDDPGSL